MFVRVWSVRTLSSETPPNHCMWENNDLNKRESKYTKLNDKVSENKISLFLV